MLLLVFALIGGASGQAGFHEGFESGEPSWEEAGGDASYRVVTHRRTSDEPHSGAACELFEIEVASPGSQVLLSHPAHNARLIDELQPSVWVRADRSGVVLLARVVLPRTVDPNTGRPITTLVQGDLYNQAGRWQRLAIHGIPLEMERRARVLRASLRIDVDLHEAYVDRVLLNVYGGVGRSRVWIDDLEFAGYVTTASYSASMSDTSTPTALPPVGSGPQLERTPAANTTADATADIVRLRGSVLLVRGRPFFPRMIEYRGEDLAFLQQRGFNTVKLSGLPDEAMLDEAARLGMWIVCPPPRPAGLEEPTDSPARLADIGPRFDPVLAWDLGQGLSGYDLELTRRWADQVRRADRQHARPLICDADVALRDYSRIVDVLNTHRAPLGTTCELADYQVWLRQRPALARPGTPSWTTLATEPSWELAEQVTAFDPRAVPPGVVDGEQLRLLIYAALAAGSRGICCESRARLDAPDPATRYRASCLELLNLELDLLDPWATSSTLLATVDGSDPNVHGAVLQTSRARLLLPVWSGPEAQMVPGEAAGNALSLVVPGIPESNEAHELTPAGLYSLRRQRVTGGVRVTIDEFGLTSAVVLTSDPTVLNALTKRLSQIGPRAAQLERDLALFKLQAVSGVERQLTATSAVPLPTERWLADASSALRDADRRLASGDYRGAYRFAQRATRPLRSLQRARWEDATKVYRSPIASPFTASFATLPQHWALVSRVRGAPRLPNRLPAGDFENLEAMLAAGWQHHQLSLSDVEISASLSNRAPRAGRSYLELRAASTDPNTALGMFETAISWVTSPEVPVSAGEIIRVHGWVRVPRSITGSVDGLVIFDSQTGMPLAERIGRTNGWQELTLYRVMPRSGSLSLTFALTGLGDVHLDDVTIEPLGASAARQTPVGGSVLRPGGPPRNPR